MTVVGFTGTSRDPTDEQVERLRLELARIARETFAAVSTPRFHHGDCIGADEAAHWVAVSLGYQITTHPADDEKARAFCAKPTSAVTVLDPEPYMVRNQAIADAATILVACPRGPERSYPRSGTWATVRRTRERHIPIRLVWPDGSATWDGE